MPLLLPSHTPASWMQCVTATTCSLSGRAARSSAPRAQKLPGRSPHKWQVRTYRVSMYQRCRHHSIRYPAGRVRPTAAVRLSLFRRRKVCSCWSSHHHLPMVCSCWSSHHHLPMALAWLAEWVPRCSSPRGKRGALEQRAPFSGYRGCFHSLRRSVLVRCASCLDCISVDVHQPGQGQDE
jgi:hypothetical protein